MKVPLGAGRGSGLPARDAGQPKVGEAIFLQSPDGSLSLGLPPGALLPAAPLSPRCGIFGDGAADQALPLPTGAGQVDFEWVYKRHERLFCGLLLTEFAADFLYCVTLAGVARESVQEVATVYTTLPLTTLWNAFWIIFACEIGYLKLYYVIGFGAVLNSRQSYFQLFSSTAAAGLVIQVIFAYMNTYNILLFMFRFLAFTYAKYLRVQLQRLALLPIGPSVHV